MIWLLFFENRIPAVRGTTRTDERPTAHAKTLESTAHFYDLCATVSGPPKNRVSGGFDRARMPPAGAAFGMAVSIDLVRVHNETPSHSLRTRHVGLPWG